MKRWLAAVLTVLMMTTFFTAWADTTDASELEVGVITRLENGAMVDLDSDGIAEQVKYEILQEDGYDIGYRLTVGDAQIVRSGCYMDTDMYILKLTEYAQPMVLVCDYGPSDDYVTYFHSYENGVLSYVGMIDALVENMRIHDGLITASVRANVLYTWYRPADFGVAHSSGIDYDSEELFVPMEYAIYEIPRYLYPMGLIVTLKVDLPLRANINDQKDYCVLPAGAKVILAATDDKKWVYIQSVDDWMLQGWMEVVGEFGMECQIGNQVMFSDEVFDGLLFAD